MKLIRLTEVKEITGLGRTSIYNFMNEGKFPESVSLGERAVAWVKTEVEEWVQVRIEQRDNKAEITEQVLEQQLTEQDVIQWINNKFGNVRKGEAVNWLLSI